MRIKMLGAIAALVWVTAAPALAHHSFAAEFDKSKPTKMTGKVTGMRWSNPHAWIYIDVQGSDGKVVNWAFETTGVNALYRRGWRKEDLVPGTMLTIEGWLSRNGTPVANASNIRLPDGRQLFAGSADDTSAPK